MFRSISWAEGISYLLILFVTMPLKYVWEIGWPNKIVGSVHGILFIAYLVFAYLEKNKRSWSWKTFGIVSLCSIIPFGTFWMDKKYLSHAPNQT